MSSQPYLHAKCNGVKPLLSLILKFEVLNLNNIIKKIKKKIFTLISTVEMDKRFIAAA